MFPVSVPCNLQLLQPNPVPCNLLTDCRYRRQRGDERQRRLVDRWQRPAHRGQLDLGALRRAPGLQQLVHEPAGQRRRHRGRRGLPRSHRELGDQRLGMEGRALLQGVLLRLRIQDVK